jgi:hypothetical protein
MKTKYILMSVIISFLLYTPSITMAADSEAYLYAKNAVDYITDKKELNALITYIKKQIKLLGQPNNKEAVEEILEEARVKGRDASIKAYVSNARAQAELFYDGNSFKYKGFCKSSFMVELTTALKEKKSTVMCTDTDTAYRMSGSLNDKSIYCADSTGAAVIVKKMKKGTLTCE